MFALFAFSMIMSCIYTGFLAWCHNYAIAIPAGTKTLTVTVEDDGGRSDTENVVLQFIDATVVISPTTDRNWEFIGILTFL